MCKKEYFIEKKACSHIRQKYNLKIQSHSSTVLKIFILQWDQMYNMQAVYPLFLQVVFVPDTMKENKSAF